MDTNDLTTNIGIVPVGIVVLLEKLTNFAKMHQKCLCLMETGSALLQSFTCAVGQHLVNSSPNCT